MGLVITVARARSMEQSSERLNLETGNPARHSQPRELPCFLLALGVKA